MNVTTINSCLESEVIYNECKSVEILARGAANIANYNLKYYYTTLVLINSTIICGVNTFMSSYSKSMGILNKPTSPIMQNTKQFIMFVYNLENIRHLLQWIKKYNYDNTGKFFVICQSNQTQECDEKEAVNILWEHKILNVIFMNMADNGTGYSYDIDKSCEPGPPFKVKDWDDCVMFGKKCIKKFPLKFRNLYGCPIIVSTFHQPPYMDLNNGVPSGADGDLLRILIKALNASLILRTPWRGDGWGNLNVNGTWVGSLGDLYYDLANFSMTSASITMTRSEDFQMSSFYFHLKLVWITHPPIKEAPTFKLMRPFNSSARNALGIFFVVFSFVMLMPKTKACKSLLERVKISGMPNNNLFYYFIMCIGQPVVIQTKKTKVLSFILIWIFHCFLIRTFYQVHLINSLKNDVYVTNFVTIEEAIRNKYKFGGGLALRDYYVYEPEVYNNWEEVNSGQYVEVMNNLTRGTKFVLAINLATTKYFLKQPGKKLHVLPQKIITSPTVLFFKKFSLLVRPINQIFTRLVECGIPEMLFKNATTTNYVYKPDSNDKALKFEDCAGCFVLLMMGHIISFIVLIAEICIEKFKKYF